MIQFNLLPDVKIQYLKAEQARKIVTIVSLAVTAAAIVFLGIVLAVNFYKNQHLNNLTSEIQVASNKLKSQKDIDRKLTVQNQLTSLTALHDEKPAVPRLFEYLNQITPNGVIGISELKVDFNESTATITGVSDSLTNVNKYVDTLKFTKFRADKDDPAQAFTAVVLSEFTYATPEARGKSTDLPATFTIEFAFAPEIFDNTKKIKLEVPSIITTRSAVTVPTELLKPAPDQAQNEETN